MLLPLALALALAAPDLVGAAGTSGAPVEAGLTPLQVAGRSIYLTGRSPSGAGLTALMGTDPSPLPGSALPCAGCHGPDGRGRPEGGVVPPDITWSELIKPYGHVHPNRRHPRFDARSIGRAITEGVDPAGQRLEGTMPRYALSRGDLTALLAWLEVLERQREPGVGERSLRLATALPAGEGRLGEVGEALRVALEAALGELNAAGGLHGRRLELTAVRYDPARESGVAALARSQQVSPAFALLSGFVPGEDAALAALAERLELPLVGPYGPFTDGQGGRFTFHPLAGLRELGQVLVAWAAGRSGLGLADPALAVLHPAGAPFEAAARAAREEAVRRGWARVEVLPLPQEGLDEAGALGLRQRGVEVALVLGDDQVLASVLRAADAAAFHPWVLAPGTLAARAAADAPAGFEGRLRLAYPALPSDESEAGRAQLARLAPAGLGERHRAARTSALVATAVLAEGLRRTGRDLSRAGLVAALESLSGFDSGLSPPLGFGGQRRVGARGGHVVAVDLAGRAFRPVGGWLRLE
ncbi:MAG: ABC transporter substrate-binding protein [Anaeromyxobacter sp.]|nr:ABC transporter substrate-binding protein [Anaeromyxobacter sp.]MBL0277907.1 ABC transporter substrate-binding protein [Anaeromyxobacter sp.]